MAEKERIVSTNMPDYYKEIILKHIDAYIKACVVRIAKILNDSYE